MQSTLKHGSSALDSITPYSILRPKKIVCFSLLFVGRLHPFDVCCLPVVDWLADRECDLTGWQERFVQERGGDLLLFLLRFSRPPGWKWTNKQLQWSNQKSKGEERSKWLPFLFPTLSRGCGPPFSTLFLLPSLLFDPLFIISLSILVSSQLSTTKKSQQRQHQQQTNNVKNSLLCLFINHPLSPPQHHHRHPPLGLFIATLSSLAPLLQLRHQSRL